MEKFIVILIITFFFGGFIYLSRKTLLVHTLFRWGKNPFRRYCKKCGACQVMYGSNIQGCEHDTWWEEVYPIGDNPDCKCHKYATYRS